MVNVDKYAIQILRILDEKKVVGGKLIRNSEVLSQLNLVLEDYRTAVSFLLSEGCVKAYGMGKDGKITLTSKGVSFLSQRLKERYPLSLDSEILLGFIVENCPRKGNSINIPSLALVPPGMGFDDINSAISELESFHLVNIISPVSLEPTAEGRQAVLRNFRDPMAQATHTGQHFYGPITAQNFQAIASATDSLIQQSITINGTDTEALKQQLSEAIEGLVKQLESELDLEQRLAYLEAATKLKQEAIKKNREASILQKWLSRLAFLDSALSVGDKALTLSQKALPSILVIIKIIEAMSR
jgi:predicted transcriptional regulator